MKQYMSKRPAGQSLTDQRVLKCLRNNGEMSATSLLLKNFWFAATIGGSVGRLMVADLITTREVLQDDGEFDTVYRLTVKGNSLVSTITPEP